MQDIALLTFKAGDGGHGRVSFRREKYIPKGGPDGGNGGNGGSVILKASNSVATLDHMSGKTEYAAKPGAMGGKKRMTGHGGEDLVIPVPVGTVVWLLAENSEAYRWRQRRLQPEGSRQYSVQHEKYFLEEEGQTVPEMAPDELKLLPGIDAIPESLKNADIRDFQRYKIMVFTELDQEFVLCKGGEGGHGSEAFKGPSNTTPLEAEYGTRGAEVTVLLEAKLLADVGLVGFPNAGKSTLLSVVSSAQPKIADYPFTTLIPHIGVWTNQTLQRQLVVADIPGLVEYASQGKGLGFDFLRHIENCKVICFVLAPDENQLFVSELTEAEVAASLKKQYDILVKELAEYSNELASKPAVVIINKIDILPQTYIDYLKDFFKQMSLDCLFISGATHDGLDELFSRLILE